MDQKRRAARGARVEWMKCDCPSPTEFGLFLRCGECGFLFRDGPPLTRVPTKRDRLSKTLLHTA
jgi:hypothetical protein